MSFTRLASQCPAVQVSSAVYLRSASYAASGGLAPSARRFAAGDTSTVSGKLNETGTQLDILAASGGGSVRAVINGLGLTANGSNLITVAAGQARIDGIVELAANASGIAVSSGWNYVWLQQPSSGGVGTVTITTTTTAPTSKSCFLGQINISAGTGTPDYSGVCYVMNGIACRSTNDATTPSDSPNSGIILRTITQSGMWEWSGAAWYPVQATRASLGAAASGANTDITSLGGLTTPLSVGQGGTGATTAAAARASLSAAAAGANIDILSLAGLTTPLSAAQGGTGDTLGAEPPLGNPATDLFVLASTVAGVRSWISVTAATGGTVVSVGLNVPGGMSVTGSPVINTGVLAFSLSVTGLLKDDGAGGFAAAVPNTDYAAAAHASRHHTAGADALAPSDIGAEPSLGNPGTNGYLLAKTTLGVPSWVAPGVSAIGLTLPSSILSVTSSTITSSGNLTAVLQNQSMNTFWAGPVSGAAAQPAFRALVTADLPTTAVTPGTYGDATHVGSFTVDATGRITSASNVPVTGGSALFSAVAENGLPASPSTGAAYIFTDALGSVAYDGARWQTLAGARYYRFAPLTSGWSWAFQNGASATTTGNNVLVAASTSANTKAGTRTGPAIVGTGADITIDFSFDIPTFTGSGTHYFAWGMTDGTHFEVCTFQQDHSCRILKWTGDYTSVTDISSTTHSGFWGALTATAATRVYGRAVWNHTGGGITYTYWSDVDSTVRSIDASNPGNTGITTPSAPAVAVFNNNTTSAASANVHAQRQA